MRSSNVLIVDDDDAIRRLLVEYFVQQGDLRVDWARDGVEALHRVSTNRYAAIVLDVVMPKMTGIDLLHSLRELRRGAPTPPESPAVFVITSTPESELPDNVLEHFDGLVAGVFRKPLDVNALVSAIETRLG
jgi:CheY-like chemotaxis protein